MIPDHVILAVLWILYGVLHSVLAGVKLKSRFRKLMGAGFKYYRIGYTVFSFVTFIALLYYQISMSSPLVFRPVWLTRIAGGIISLSGLVLMLVCIRKYFMSLSGLASLVNGERSGQLMIEGIHRYVRHPLYLGTFVFIWGLFLYLPVLSLGIANTIITGYTLVGIRLEEDKLVHEFGEPYREYRRRVPKLLPLFWSKRRMEQLYRRK